MVENAFGILVSTLRVLIVTMEQRPKVVKDIVLMCVVLHSMLRCQVGGPDRPPMTADDIQPAKADQADNTPVENFRNLSKEAKHQIDLLKDYFNHLEALAVQQDMI